MACSFSTIVDACGCLTGYNVPLLGTDNSAIVFPLHVLNVNEVDLGEAATPSEYVALWNADTDNQAVGLLSVGSGTYCFVLGYKAGVGVPPSKVQGSATAPEPPDNMTVLSGHTDLVTTGEEPHTEAEYTGSIGASSGSQVVAVTAPTITVPVSGFDNGGTDKVDFLEVPLAADAFTKWSVLNDPLQQDLPIDAAFDINSGNVWFKSTGASTFYMTYSQTTFGNSVIFSR